MLELPPRLAPLLGAILTLSSVGCSRSSASERTEPSPLGSATMTHSASQVERLVADPAREQPGREEREEPFLVALGRAIFFDTTLSEPAGTSCASCHDPNQAFSGQNGSATGVPRGSRPDHQARRSSPSLSYLKYVPKFQYAQEEGEPEPVPMGGLFWDGRADTIAELVVQPLMNPDEMNNHDAAAIALKVRSAPYASRLEQRFGDLSDAQRTLSYVGEAVEAFLTTDEMAPFSSRFDDFVRGQSQLSALELEGLKLFKDPAKGACAGCHRVDEANRDPSRSPFTDYGYDAVAAPRNPELPRDRKPDLGLCERTDRRTPSNAPSNCALFRTPSLRNVAARSSYMHNGTFKSLRDAVAFYSTRETDPQRWYGSGVKYEDVPAQYRKNVNVTASPYNRRTGDAPALTDAEIDAIVAFLQTLTDAPRN
jgi:cytochrome c peroxidase